MTGYPEWNFPAFAEATEELRSVGYEVVSPHEIDLEGGFDPKGGGAGFDLRAALERDVEEVLNADGVALLDGWEESPGAVVEVLAASSTGAPAKRVREWIAAAGALLVAVILSIGGGAAPAASEETSRRIVAKKRSAEAHERQKEIREVREERAATRARLALLPLPNAVAIP